MLKPLIHGKKRSGILAKRKSKSKKAVHTHKKGCETKDTNSGDCF